MGSGSAQNYSQYMNGGSQPGGAPAPAAALVANRAQDQAHANAPRQQTRSAPVAAASLVSNGAEAHASPSQSQNLDATPPPSSGHTVSVLAIASLGAAAFVGRRRRQQTVDTSLEESLIEA